MTKKQLPKLNDLPYSSTKISVAKTQADISQLLQKYQIEGYQWTWYKGKTILRFVFNGKPYMLSVPRTLARKYVSGGWKTIEVEDRITYRIFYWALKSILEMNEYGVMDLNRLLLSYQLIQVGDQLVSVGDLIEANPNYLLGEPDKLLLR